MIETIRVLASDGIAGLADPLLNAELFRGPHTISPDTTPHHLLMVPVHDGARAGRIWRNGSWRDISLAAPLIHVVEAGERVGFSWREDAQVLRLRFEEARLRRFVAGELRLIHVISAMKGRQSVADGVIHDVALRMRAVLEDDRPGQGVLWKALSEVMVVHIARAYLEAREAGGGGLSHELYSTLLDYIDAGLHRPIRVTDLADHVNMSESAFLRAVKSTTGMTPHELVRIRRLEAARDMLRDRQMSLGQIAAATGFADQAHLSRLFKQAYGEAPSRWRQAAQGGHSN